MNVFGRIQATSSALKGLVERRASHLMLQCREMGIPMAEARLVVMWGGGKDSSLALILASAVAELADCTIRAVTMVHPGLTRGTFANIESIRKELNVSHEWRQFLTLVSHPGDANNRDWIEIYKRLAYATAFHPRFMCVACNLGATVTEYKALADTHGHFRVTGNPVRELMKFDGWAATLKRRFSESVAFPPVIGHVLLDYYRLWWAIYRELLMELSAICGSNDRGCDASLEISRYLYQLPLEDSPVALANVFSVLEDDNESYEPVRHMSLLKEFGWRFPNDIQGGTESDCAMPAAIATINIQQHGVPDHLLHLRQAAEALSAVPEMMERAVSWTKSGKSVVEGKKMLLEMGLSSEIFASKKREATPVAGALVEQLLPVR